MPPKVITVTVPNDPVEVVTVQLPGAPGPVGPANTLTIGTVTTGAAGSNASASVTGISPNQTLNLTIPQGLKGDKGDKGDTGNTGSTGPSNVLSIGTVSTGAAGSSAAATITGTSPSQVLNLTIPQGLKGDKGDKGDTGNTGPANSLAIGTVTTGNEGTNASATITGTAPSQTLSLTIPRGNTGAAGPANVLSIGTVTTGAAGSSAAVTITGTSPSQTLNFTIPQGAKGDKGDTGNTGATGPANTLAIGTVTTGAAGSSAAATITGTAPNQTLNLTIPQGIQGTQGVKGDTGSTGAGVAAGGSAGQVLAKIDATNYNTQWVTPLTIGTTGTTAAAGNHTHTDLTNATNIDTANTLVKRDSQNSFNISRLYISQTPNSNDSATRKDYVDSQDAATRRVSYNNTVMGAGPAYTLALADEGKLLSNNSTTQATTVTIPANATVAFPVGAWIDIVRWNTQTLTIAAAAGVNLGYRGVYVTANSFSMLDKEVVRLHKISTDVWMAYDLSMEVDNSTKAPYSIVQRDGNGWISAQGIWQLGTPFESTHAATKGYVDGLVADSGWVNVTISSGFAAHSGFPPQVRKIGNVVYLRGGWSNTGMAANSGYNVGTLPSGYWPNLQIIMSPGMSSSGSTGRIIIDSSTGTVQVTTGGTVASYFKMDGHSFPLG